MLTVCALPILSDNYIWVLHDGRRAVAVDPGEAAPLTAWLARQRLELAAVLITHRHWDHVNGLPALLASHATLPVFGPPGIDHIRHPLVEGDTVDVLGQSFTVLAIPGHTREHLAYLGAGRLFCGDTLFGAGCGRMFDGPPEHYQASLARLAALPTDTLVHCTHEYTASNLRFAAAVEPDNPAITARMQVVSTLRAQNQPSVPFTLAEELATNPFLRLTQAAVQDAARRQGAASLDAAELFRALRAWKDHF
ncbi:hydroxyacylglutathione hydrolase [Chitinilyticum litopenaei]|uniref:hydroxyacylglutathione hydrolase n=1 Tax=Chitinilyticum litopenaei TaxID=1121276 RepID=UPI000402A707|nr:hydroxyacylglutathione hydrolase [Chitinilyticum litopenaei]